MAHGFMPRPLDVWVHTHSSGTLHAVRYGRYTLAQFVRKELALAYRDWFWSRRVVYLNDTRLGRFTLEDLLRGRRSKS